nr:MAG TPA: hypothetical protein [Caudoviricetes sp.]
MCLCFFLHAKITFPFMRREVKYAFLTAFTFSFDICERRKAI